MSTVERIRRMRRDAALADRMGLHGEAAWLRATADRMERN